MAPLSVSAQPNEMQRGMCHLGGVCLYVLVHVCACVCVPVVLLWPVSLCAEVALPKLLEDKD